MVRFFAVCLVFCPTAVDAAGKGSKRPNILILIADDWSYPHASGLGTKGIKTPNIDKLIAKGKNFTNAFVAAPSCTPSRAAILTGRFPHSLKEGGNLWGILPAEFPTFTDYLERSGYHVGFTGKPWAPGSLEGSGRTKNPVGDRFKGIDEFLKVRKKDQPFFFWFGSSNPHRPYKKGSGVEAGLRLSSLKPPAVWPDTEEVRSDILDYYLEVMAFDTEVGQIVEALREAGLLGDTLILVLSDNGMPFPRAKANLYDLGTHVPLIVSWPGNCPEGKTSGSFISYVDIAPTLLDAAGVPQIEGVHGKSFINLITGNKEDKKRTQVFFERERHANVRKGDASYPSRALRDDKFLYIRNFRSDRWPAGDPETHFAVGPFGDIDDGPTKQALMALRKGTLKQRQMWELSMDFRPEDELYDLAKDPYQRENLAYDYHHLEIRSDYRGKLDVWMRETADPRLAPDGGDDRWDRYRYFGAGVGEKKKAKEP